MPIRSPLTREQRTAATASAARAFIIAGPGSGKTTVAAERFGVVRYDTAADLRRILAVSFTRSACSELAARVRRRWGNRALAWPHRVLTLDTLHCEILTFLLRRRMISWMGDHTELTVLDTWRGQSGARWIQDNTGYRRFVALRGTTVKSVGGRVHGSGYYISTKSAFDAHLVAGRCTHTEVRQIIAAALGQAELRAEVSSYLAATTKAVIVDEVFDANELDLELILLGAEAGIRSTVIGDRWQALYDFRGARPDLIPRFIEYGEFESFEVTDSFRFKTPEMVQIADGARNGRSIHLNEATDPTECDVILASRWDTLWAGPDSILPFSFGRLDNQTDAAVTLLLDRFVQGRFGQPAIYAVEAAALLGLDHARLRNDGTLIDTVLTILRHGTAKAASAAIDMLRWVLRDLGSPCRLRRMPEESEKTQHQRLLDLARRMRQSHIVAGITVHQAKGREWPIVGLRLTDSERIRLAAGLEYDRFGDRVLYVALTRAATKVVHC